MGQSVLGETILFIRVSGSSGRVPLVDLPQAAFSLTEAGVLYLGGGGRHRFQREVMLIQQTLRAGGEPQAMSQPRATEQCCGENLVIQLQESCGQLETRSCQNLLSSDWAVCHIFLWASYNSTQDTQIQQFTFLFLWFETFSSIDNIAAAGLQLYF